MIMECCAKAFFVFLISESNRILDVSSIELSYFIHIFVLTKTSICIFAVFTEDGVPDKCRSTTAERPATIWQTRP